MNWDENGIVGTRLVVLFHLQQYSHENRSRGTYLSPSISVEETS